MLIADQIAVIYAEAQTVRHDISKLTDRLESSEGALVPLEKALGHIRQAQQALLTARTWWIAGHPVQDPAQLSLEVVP